jgi:hypothetical protein
MISNSNSVPNFSIELKDVQKFNKTFKLVIKDGKKAAFKKFPSKIPIKLVKS